MIGRLFILVVFLAELAACSHSSHQRNKEDYPDFKSEMEPSVPKVVTPVLRNTDTFHSVEIKAMKFVPEELHVQPGDTVEWINRDITDHDITEEVNKLWTSSRLSVGESWQKIIRQSDNYYCSIHVVMKGKLIVD